MRSSLTTFILLSNSAKYIMCIIIIKIIIFMMYNLLHLMVYDFIINYSEMTVLTAFL